MTLVNQTISHYKIVSLLGEGGMGEVYRARDTKLGRDVAIKVLPAAFSTNAERLRRFEQLPARRERTVLSGGERKARGRGGEGQCFRLGVQRAQAAVRYAYE